jgi:two-component system, OmpR family, heavy metal sensor histidine kinase CusS
MPADRPPRRPLSLALRITACVGLAMTAVFVTFTLRIEASIEDHFAEQDLGELRAVADSLSTALGAPAAVDGAQALEHRLSHAVAGHHGVYFSVRDAQGRPLYGTAPDALFDLARQTPTVTRLDTAALRVWSVQDHTYRGAVLRLGDATVLVAAAMDFHLRYLDQLRAALWWGTLAASAAAVLAAWLAVTWGHAPLRRISGTVRGITPEQLHVRLDPAAVPGELAHLVASFNSMLDQLQQSFQRLSHFSADIAHELRTPVTNLTTQAQVALSKPRPIEAYQEVLYSSLEELERMGKMISDMLFLAQSDHRLAAPEMTSVDLAAETRALFDYFDAWAEHLGVRLVLEGEAPAVRGDRLMLRRALSNLIANALHHTPRSQAVTVRLRPVEHWAEVRVENPGAEIPAPHLPRLFDRFYRIDAARQRNGVGAGLGLAIVKSIVEAHGGSVSVSSAAGLTCFSVRLPLAVDGVSASMKTTP